MLRTVILLLAVCSLAQSSGVEHFAPFAAAPPVAVGPPVVTAASSQYFERTFNRLVAAQPVIPVAVPPPVVHIASAPAFIPVAAPPPVAVELARTVPVNPPQVPVDPNIAIAVATAHAAAPVATILLPPYPFGPPPTFEFVPQTLPVVPNEDRKESTTPRPTQPQTTTIREPEQTTPLPLPSNTDNTFAQPLPLQNVNFRYGPPLPQPLPQPLPSARPQKLRTSVEVVPVPLQYIAPPPIRTHVKPVKLVHAFVPARTRVFIRPVSAPLRIRTVRVPARIVAYRASARNSQARSLRPLNSREIEPTTFRPLNRPGTKPPRV